MIWAQMLKPNGLAIDAHTTMRAPQQYAAFVSHQKIRANLVLSTIVVHLKKKKLI